MPKLSLAQSALRISFGKWNSSSHLMGSCLMLSQVVNSTNLPMLGQVLAALLHLDQGDRLPDIVGECRPAAVFFRLADVVPGLAPDIQ
ncbi:MAG: hypothetical protein AABP62_10325 [Planctomycetota bacterium]